MKNKTLIKAALLIVSLASTVSTVSAATVSYSGQLDLTNLNFPVSIGGLQGNASVDMIRFDLGNNLSGNDVQMSLTTSDFSPLTTGVGVAITTDPNNGLLVNPTPILDLFSPGSNVSDFFNNNVDGGVLLAWGNAINAGGVTDVTGIFDSPIEFTQDTNYYAFIIGGSLSPTMVDTQLQVTAVPIPAAWLFMLSGLGLFAFLKKKKQSRDSVLSLSHS